MQEHFSDHAGGCGPKRERREVHSRYEKHAGGRGGGFGVRRPLRFLAHKLELSEAQVGQLAAILDDLKIERAQAEVDERRAMAAFADALGAEAFDAKAVGQATEARAETAARVHRAAGAALEKTYEVLEPEQRKIFAYLIRSGAISI